MSAHPNVIENAPVWSRQHWLENCEEFRVEGVGGVLGFVEEVEPAELDGPDWLVIECRGGEPAQVRVASTEVLDVDPQRCLVTLRPPGNVLPIRRRAVAG